MASSKGLFKGGLFKPGLFGGGEFRGAGVPVAPPVTPPAPGTPILFDMEGFLPEGQVATMPDWTFAPATVSKPTVPTKMVPLNVFLLRACSNPTSPKGEGSIT